MSELSICLMGPTASGKTALACELVQRFPLEIISVDSMMIYKEMNIGTAKPDVKTQALAPHHLLDILDPTEHYSAADFCTDVNVLSAKIRKRGKIPLLTGGTMMYFHALQQGLSALPESNPDIRDKLLQKANTLGWAYLHQELAKVDAESAARIHPKDTQRIQRALEVYELTGKPLSFFIHHGDKERLSSSLNMILMPIDRTWLHQRIAGRFEAMLQEGLIEEVEYLLQKWELNLSHGSLRSVGYRQVFAYLANEYDYNELLYKGTVATRQLAKRQLTWLRHWPEGHMFIAENPRVHEEIMVFIEKILDNYPP